MELSDLTGATILRVHQLGGGGFILVTDKGTVSALGVSQVQLELPSLLQKKGVTAYPSINQ